MQKNVCYDEDRHASSISYEVSRAVPKSPGLLSVRWVIFKEEDQWVDVLRRNHVKDDELDNFCKEEQTWLCEHNMHHHQMHNHLQAANLVEDGLHAEADEEAKN